MKDFIFHLIASVICFTIGFVLIHYLFVMFGWSQSEPLGITIGYGAGMGVLFGIVDFLYKKFKKK